jgi:hypothetical protein
MIAWTAGFAGFGRKAHEIVNQATLAGRMFLLLR